MDPDLRKLAREYRRRDGALDEDEARDDLMDLYELYTGDYEPHVPEFEGGWIDSGVASGAAVAARTVVDVLGLGPLKRPAGLLARQGVKRSREDAKLMRWVREDRHLLRSLVRRRVKS